MEGFAGKVCVITGAGSGIGQALALELGRSGAKLAISDVDLEGLLVVPALLPLLVELLRMVVRHGYWAPEKAAEPPPLEF